LLRCLLKFLMGFTLGFLGMVVVFVILEQADGGYMLQSEHSLELWLYLGATLLVAILLGVIAIYFMFVVGILLRCAAGSFAFAQGIAGLVFACSGGTSTLAIWAYYVIFGGTGILAMIYQIWQEYQAQKKAAEERALNAAIKLEVRNLDDEIDDDKLREAFCSLELRKPTPKDALAPLAGEEAPRAVTYAKVTLDEDGKSTGEAVVGFATLEEAKQAAEEMNGVLLNGKPLDVSLAPGQDTEVEHGHEQASSLACCLRRKQPKDGEGEIEVAEAEEGADGKFLGIPMPKGGACWRSSEGEEAEEIAEAAKAAEAGGRKFLGMPVPEVPSCWGPSEAEEKAEEEKPEEEKAEVAAAQGASEAASELEEGGLPAAATFRPIRPSKDDELVDR